MARQIRLARDKLRQVDPSMTALFDVVSPAEFDQVLNYVSYLPVPTRDLAPDTSWRNPDFK